MRYLIFALLFTAVVHTSAQTDTLSKSNTLEEVVVNGVGARSKDPVTFTNIGKREIEKNNFGQDMPFLLNMSPSTVVFSDAGAGIGYTGIRIRGTDPARTNVTVNGVPINDAESHGMFWVNMPDMASSVNRVQVQRGVGTSTNGAGAFGASINVQTDVVVPEPYTEASTSLGSFNTQKYTLRAGTGRMKNNWAFDMRLSKIQSDGFIERASSDLKSFFVSTAYYGKKSIFKVNVFSGKEITYQSWNGLSEDKLLKGERTHNEYTYANQVDNYQQDHYQLFYAYAVSPSLTAHIGLHYTYGRGYYEEYGDNESFTTYKLQDTLIRNGDTLTSGDFIRRRWLDNDFYGTIFSLTYEKKKWNLIVGGGVNRYEGRHFGELIWAEYTQGSELNQRFYEGKSDKIDGNVYSKFTYKFTDQWQAFVDIQQRYITYDLIGEDLNSGVYLPYDFSLTYTFFNPKVGMTYSLNTSSDIYAYVGMANKEPIRNDIIRSGLNSIPKPERLINYELGYRKTWKKASLITNLYFMDYTDQLIMTGEVNDVGAYNRVNVPESYRAGIELTGGIQVMKYLRWEGTFTYSQNRIRNFTEYVTDENTYVPYPFEYKNTSIAFSPDIVAASQIQLGVYRNMGINFMTKYVGTQYLDNTENSGRMLDAFLVNDLRFHYDIQLPKVFRRVVFGISLNNIFDEAYEPNGYTYSGLNNGIRNDYNYYYPQAGRNVMVSLQVTL